MPAVSRFLGIEIAIHSNDHDPPRFHARYGGQEVSIAIRDLGVLDGRLSPRALGLVVEWAVRHQEELLANWERARRGEPLKPIPPLE